jgi:hypothetical protein
MRTDQPNSPSWLVMLNIVKPPTLASVDVALMWVPFAIGRFLAASSNNELPAGVPSFYRGIAEKKGPLLKTLQTEIAKSGTVPTLRQLYSGAGSYLVQAYAPLVAVEFAIHKMATQLKFDDKQATLLTGCVGGVVASFGETRMIQGKKLKGTFADGLISSIKNTRGTVPTIGREILFSMVAISGMQSQLSTTLFPYLWQSLVLSTFASSLLCSPLLLLTQPPVRVAAFMQAQPIKISTRQALRSIWAEAEKSVNQSGERRASTIKNMWQKIIYAFFRGGAFRTGSIIGTSVIYGVGNQLFKMLEERSHRENSCQKLA